MTAVTALRAFRDQVARGTGLKTVLGPSPIKEALGVKVSFRKLFYERGTQGTKKDPELSLQVECLLEGKADSEVGLEMAVDAMETLARYLAGVTRLEDDESLAIPGTRVTAKVGEDESVIDDPTDGSAALVDDRHSVTIRVPA